jgi:hypothetical protein
MPVWLTQLFALSAMVGVIGFCFWMARGGKPRKGNTDDFQAVGLPDNSGPGHG